MLMIIRIFLFWRIGLFLITLLGSYSIAKIDNGGIGSIGPGREFNYWASWAQWDGGHYYHIAKQGYVFLQDYAFFPLYPTLISFLKRIFFGNLLLTGLLVSNIAFFFFLLIFYRLIKKKYNQEVAIMTLGTFLTFPTTFFAVSYYSEAVFLILTIAVFYFLNEKKFLLAAAATSLASLTRLVGAALIISVFYSYLASIHMNFKKITMKLLLVIPAIFGFAIYSLFLFAKLNDPFKFLTSQGTWERSITDPISTILDYIWAIVTRGSRPINDYFDLFLTLLFLLVLILGIKKISSSLWLFSILVILIPASTGTLTSMPRYLLSSLGVFVILGQYFQARPRLKVLIWSVSLFVQAILAVRFINGYWVA